MGLFKNIFGSSKKNEPTLYHYQLKFTLFKDKFSLEDFDEKISRPIQDLFGVYLGLETGELYDIEHEEDEVDDDLLGYFTFSFSSENQFRWEGQEEEVNETFPLYSSNLRVPFTMKGGFFSELALIMLQNESEGEATDVPFYNKELDQWCEVQISKELDADGISFGRFVDVF
tara:strand:- start:242 stop:757 length:516 start_codon:yes stop_codon:yes gene_type:complete